MLSIFQESIFYSSILQVLDAYYKESTSGHNHKVAGDGSNNHSN